MKKDIKSPITNVFHILKGIKKNINIIVKTNMDNVENTHVKFIDEKKSPKIKIH